MAAVKRHRLVNLDTLFRKKSGLNRRERAAQPFEHGKAL